jgi:protein-S-isoprenylcysteine O-methyltransferase Ste14
MLPVTVFAIVSAGIVYVSRASLRSPGSHGFYRFFVWELIAALFVLNAVYWFRNPFSAHQIVSWFLLVVSVIPLAFGVRALVSKGKAAKERESDPALLAFEKTTVLVTTGIYGYIRHPLYSSLLFLAWGIFFKAPTGYAGLLAAAATFFLLATVGADEKECIRFFGQPYRDYMKRSKRFVPFLF